MRYNWLRQRGLLVGSGVVEASCKTVIGQRLKQSGMRWTVSGADASEVEFDALAVDGATMPAPSAPVAMR